MVPGTSRMSSVTIKRQPAHQQKRKCTRADPTQTGILLKNYESQARPSAAQFAVMSQETNLPVEWIKKWFLRKRKADGKNRTLIPSVPTFVENDPPIHEGQALGHAHSNFWSVDAFVAADSTTLSLGQIPKLSGHPANSLPPGDPDKKRNSTRRNEEERETFSPVISAAPGYGYASPSDSALAREGVETIASATCSLREALLGADAFSGFLSPANDDPLGPPSECPNVTLPADCPASALLHAASFVYPDSPYEGSSGSEGAIDWEFGLTNYGVSSVSSLDTIGDFILASGDLDFVPTTPHSTPDNLQPGPLDATTGCLGLDLGSLHGFSDISSYMMNVFGEPSAFYESIVSQGTNEDPMGDSINLNDNGGFLGTDVCSGVAPMTTGHESTSALELSLVNFDHDTCDSTAPIADFGGFDGRNDDDVHGKTTEGVDLGENFWTDGFDTMFV